MYLKRIIIFVLTVSLILGSLSACKNTDTPSDKTVAGANSEQDKNSSQDANIENINSETDDNKKDDLSNNNGIEIDEETNNSSNKETEELKEKDDGSPNAEKYKNSPKIQLFSNGAFNYTIVHPGKVLEEDQKTIMKTMRLVNRTSSVKTKLYLDTDKEIIKKNDNLILFGATDKEATALAHKKLVSRKEFRYDDYIIMVDNKNIVIYSLSSKGLSLAVEFFNDTFMSEETANKIPVDYLYIHTEDINTCMSINGIDISQFVLVTEKYPSRIVVAGLEELQAVIKEKTDFEVPIVKTKDKLDCKYQITTNVSGSDFNAYSLTVKGNKVEVSGGRIYSVNAALSQFAANINNVPEGKNFNIPNGFSIKGNYSDKKVKNTNGYKLTFADEFSGNSLDKKYWYTLDYSIATQGAGGGRYSFNVDMGDDLLYLKTSAEEKPDGMYYYGSGIQSNISFQFGYIEIRAKINKGSGIFPSFWLYTDMTPEKQFHPEIDIFEFFTYDTELASQLHSWWPAGTTVSGMIATAEQNASGHIQHLNSGNTYSLPGKESFANDFHTYGCEWTPTDIKFMCDGNIYCTVNLESDLKDSYGAPLNTYMQFLNHNLRIALWSNIADAQYGKIDENTIIPNCYYVDYIHLYQQDGVGSLTIPE